MLYRRGALQQLITEYSGWVNIQLQDIIKKNKVMKEAPEKIYMSPAGVLYKGDKQQSNDIEYTLTDAFIEKAVRFLKEWDAYRVCLEGHKDWFIEQFKNYMEGE